ncbi:hypothetical protein CSPX01_01726 [Colletotrichum filicis]|nr:hypothetical protein CSPX01_01726 [Colletotrichum filicis]
MPCHAMLLRSFSLPPFEKKRVRRDCPRASGRGPARGCHLTTLSGVLVGTMMPEKMARYSLPVRPLDRSRSTLLAFWGRQPLQSRLESCSRAEQSLDPHGRMVRREMSLSPCCPFTRSTRPPVWHKATLDCPWRVRP